MIRVWRAAVLLLLFSPAACIMQAQASDIAKQARKVERKLPAKSRDAAYRDGMSALAEGDDPTAVANLAQSLGITVAELESKAGRLLVDSTPGPVTRVGLYTPAAPASEQYVAPGLAVEVEPEFDPIYYQFGYDASFDAPMTEQQQIRHDLEQAEQLYRYALTVRHIGERKALLAQAAALGSTDAEQELTFY